MAAACSGQVRNIGMVVFVLCVTIVEKATSTGSFKLPQKSRLVSELTGMHVIELA